jgi:hypothetical protein
VEGSWRVEERREGERGETSIFREAVFALLEGLLRCVAWDEGMNSGAENTGKENT